MENKQPEIRFPGFTDDWEQRKLGKIYQRNTERNKGQFGSEKTISIATMRFKPEGNGAAESSLDGYKVLRIGDIAYEGHTSKAFSFGRFVLNDIGDGIMSPRFTTLRPIISMNIFFWKQYIIYEPIMKHVLVKSTKLGTMMNELVLEDFFKCTIFVPSDNEQKMIGTYFKQLDNTITLHQQELATLKQTKQGFLQKMFPKEGAKVPEVRFSGFTDDWQQCKLGEVSDVRDGTHDSPKYVDNGFPLVTSKNLKDYGLDMSDVSLISKLDFDSINKRSNVDSGDILFGMIGTIGNPVRVENSEFAIKNVALIKEKINLKNCFLIQLLKSSIFDNYILSENAGGTQKFLALSKIRSFNLLMPTANEQEKIGAFLKQLDDTIALYQRELELLQVTKKAFLQKLFV